MGYRVPVIGVLLIAGLLLLGCTAERDEPASTPPASPLATQTLIPEQTATPVAVSTPAALPQAGVAVFDVRTGSRGVLPPTQPGSYVEFGVGSWLVLRQGGTERFFDFQGNEIPEPVVNRHTFECDVVNGAAVILGKTYAGVPTCGPVSYDISATWMLYDVPGADVPLAGGRIVSTWDQWVLNRHTDERRLLQAGLRHCGGCDGRFGPAWSPDGRFVYFAETFDKGRIFLSDMKTGTTRLISEGKTVVSAQPGWAGMNSLLYRGPNETAVLEDLGAGTRAVLSPLQWAACFDPSGHYIFSDAQKGQVQVYSVTQQTVVAILPGTLETNGNGYPLACPQPPPVQADLDDEVVSVVSRGASCGGVAVYRGVNRIVCVDLPLQVPETAENLRDDARTVLSPLGRYLALARITAVGPPHPCSLNPCTPPTITALYQANSATGASPFARKHTYEVLLVDTKTGAQRTLTTGLESTSPPQLTWDSGAEHLLVKWPFETFSGP